MSDPDTPADTPAADPYVTSAAWVAHPGRPDHIDEIADQFERPAPAVAYERPWVSGEDDPVRMWPRSARGWRTSDRLSGHRALDRRAG